MPELEAALRRIAPASVVFGAGADRLPGTICFAAPGARAASFSAGSALVGAPDAAPAATRASSCFFAPLDAMKKMATAAAASTPPPATNHTALDFAPRAASMGVMPAASAPAMSAAPGTLVGIAGSDTTCAGEGSATARRPLDDDERRDSSYASCCDVMRREMRCLVVCASDFTS